jgi:integrase
MSGVGQAVEDYLRTRRALGFKLARHGRLLPALARFLDQAGAATLTTDLTLAWASLPAGHPEECAHRLSVVRGFARYLQTLDPGTEVPPADLLPRYRRRAGPYLYSDADVVALMAATTTLRFPFRSATYCTLIGLLAVTGMRVGEAIGLDRDDLDWTHQRLTVRDGKFGASRELPLHPRTIAALARYAQLCDQRWPRAKRPFFLSLAGTRLIYENVHWTFCRLLRHVGLHPQPGSRQPRIHDLRHTFASGATLQPDGCNLVQHER